MRDNLVDTTRAVLARLADEPVETLTDAERIDLLSALEQLKGAATACQARTTVAFADSQRGIDAARGVRPEARGRGVAMQVGLAMRTSPARARRFVGFAHALPELPHTRAALTAGETSELRAFLVVRETACLTRENRLAVDAELASEPGGIGSLSDRAAEGRARSIAQRLDPAAAVRRHADAVRQRRVSLRPAPDGMTRLCATLPLTDGVRVWASLDRAAATARATGDPRSRGAVMADELVSRLLHETSPGGSRDDRCATSSTTQQSPLPTERDGPVVEEGRSPVTRPPDHQPEPRQPDIEVCLVMTDATLLGSADEHAHHEPAQVVTDTGLAGTIPADSARGLVRDAARVWVCWLFRDPTTGELVAMDSRARLFDGQLRRSLVLRDQTCRTPWCDAPVRHADHVTRWQDGGRTRAANGQGLCEACNHAKEAAQLRQQVMADGSVVTETPTGHPYRSHPPRPPGPPPQPRIDWSTLERWMRAHTPA